MDQLPDETPEEFRQRHIKKEKQTICLGLVFCENQQKTNVHSGFNSCASFIFLWFVILQQDPPRSSDALGNEADLDNEIEQLARERGFTF